MSIVVCNICGKTHREEFETCGFCTNKKIKQLEELLKGYEKIIDIKHEAISCEGCIYDIDESWCKHNEHCRRAWHKDYYTSKDTQC